MAKTSMEKKRYVLFTIFGPDKEAIGEGEAWKFFDTRCNEFLGISGLSRARLKKFDFDPATKKGIFRISNSTAAKVLGFITLFGNLTGRKARMRLLKMSGTIKTLREIANLPQRRHA